MILADTGPLVALFDPRDRDHVWARDRLAEVTQLITTVPVLTEALHLLDPGSRGAIAFRKFVVGGGIHVWFLDQRSVTRAFELMDRYSDHPMDLADASLVAASEALRVTTVLTLDRRDFATYRARIGRSSRSFRILD